DSSVPTMHPMNPSGIEMRPGLLRSYHVNAPVSGAPGGPPQTIGLMMISPNAEMTPVSTPVTAPTVLKRRQVSASSSAGKLALAAMAKASPTMKETFRPSPPMMAMAMAMAPMVRAATLAAMTSSRSEFWPLRMMLDQMSWATALDAESTSPATTARIVAKATPAI